jgi:methyl-accepting chemotaxis protein
MIDVTIQRRLFFGFALGPLALLVIGWIAYTNIQNMVELRDERNQSFTLLDALGSVMTDAVNAETGQRGYLLVGDESYLAPFQAGRDALNGDLRRVMAFSNGNPQRQQQLQRLQTLLQSKLDELNTTVEMRRTKGLDAAMVMVRAGTGKTYMDEARNIIAQIRSEEGNRLGELTAASNSETRFTFTVILYGTILAFIGVCVGGLLISRSITRPINNTVQSLASTATEILAGTTQQASSMREQSAAVSETVTTVDEVLQTANQAAERARAMADAAVSAADVGASGKQAVMNTLTMMSEVKDQTSAIAETILSLSERAQAIGEIIAAVNEITERSNLLALNAAIEASRAGEQGRGFSVVASEIKSLADQSKKATAQVRQILGDIQKSTNTAVFVTEQGTKTVHQAIRAATESGETITSLVDTIDVAARAAAQISASASQQATGMTQIHQAMAHINEASNQNLAATRQSEQAAQDLHTMGTRLKAMVVGGG